MHDTLSQTEALNVAHAFAKREGVPVPIWFKDRASDEYPRAYRVAHTGKFGDGYEVLCHVHADRTVTYPEE